MSKRPKEAACNPEGGKYGITVIVGEPVTVLAPRPDSNPGQHDRKVRCLPLGCRLALLLSPGRVVYYEHLPL